MKRFVLSTLGVAAFVVLSSAAVLADTPNLTGKWTIHQAGLNGASDTTVTLTQSGQGIVGSNATTGNGFTGTFVDESKINGTWHGPGGAGWLTVYASPNGHSFNGTWGYNGRPANGSFTGNKFLPPSAVTTAGKWNVVAAGGSGSMAGPMVCTQSGPSSVCHLNDIVISGKFRTPVKMRATWTNGSKSGWFSYWFNGDNNSFNGEWGYGKDTSPVAGRVIGQRALS